MDKLALKYYKAIGKIGAAVQKENSADEALKSGIKAILGSIDINYAVVWYINQEDNKLHPYYWICPLDLTALEYNIGDGIVGETFEKQESIIKYEPQKHYDGIEACSLVCTPFAISEHGSGCIEFIKTESALTEDEAEICQMLALFVETEIEENIPTKTWANRNVIISVSNLEKEFVNGDITTRVLKGINFDVFEGEFLCFLGESGCGKSTILNIIGGMEKPSKGSFCFLGKDYSLATEDELTMYRRDNIGFVFQSYNLMPNLNAKQNLDLIGELVDNPMDSMDALRLVGLEERAQNFPSQLSGGQQQRISIARALIKNPKVIMADEPTAALDYATSIEVLSTFEKVVAAGTTLIMVTHNEEITRMANRVVRFRDGKVYEVSINNKPAKAIELVW